MKVTVHEYAYIAHLTTDMASVIAAMPHLACMGALHIASDCIYEAGVHGNAPPRGGGEGGRGTGTGRGKA